MMSFFILDMHEQLFIARNYLFLQAKVLTTERFFADKYEIYVNLKRIEVQDILNMREPHVQEDIMQFLDDVKKLDEATAA